MVRLLEVVLKSEGGDIGPDAEQLPLYDLLRVGARSRTVFSSLIWRNRRRYTAVLRL